MWLASNSGTDYAPAVAKSVISGTCYLVFSALCFLTGDACAWENDFDASKHEEFCAEVNARLDHMQKVKTTVQGEGGPIEVSGWIQDGQLCKIAAAPGCNGPGSDEIYLLGGKPFFVFTTMKRGDGSSIEERIYFRDRDIINWLSTDSTFVPHAEDVEATEARMTSDARRFSAALLGMIDATKSSRFAEGEFSGLEPGDYIHWKMKLRGGEERSFFVLRPDSSVEKVLAHPDEYQGRPCRIRWERRSENLPEAGGPMEIDVLLGVEWL